MFYLYSDFAVLLAASKKKNQKLSEVFTSASVSLQFPLSRAQLLHALESLRAGGYLDFSGTDARADLTLSVTEKGYTATKIGLAASIIPSLKRSAVDKLESVLCDTSVTSYTDKMSITDDEYVAINRKLYADYSIYVPFVEGFVKDDKLLFSFRSGGCGYSPMGSGDSTLSVEDDDELLKDSLDVYVDTNSGADGLLAATCDFLLVSSKVRKFTLVGDGGVYVFSLSYVKDGARLTAAKILYNKQRFIGKRDSDLDYAQCGENVLDITIPPALLSAAVLRAYSSAYEILNDSMHQMMKDLRAAGV